MKNLKIGKKLLLAFMVIIIGLASISAYGFFAIQTIADADQQMYNKDLAGLSIMDSISDTMYDLRLITLNTAYQGSSDGADLIGRNLTSTDATVQKSIQDYKKTVNSQENQNDLDTLTADFNAFKTEEGKLIDLLNQQKVDTEQINDIVSENNGAGNKVMADIYHLIKYNQDQANQSMNENQNMERAGKQILLIIAATVCAGGILLAYMITRSITKPIRKLTEAANKMALGDLNFEVSGNRKDEIGVVEKAFLHVKQAVQTLIEDTRQLTQAALEGNLTVRADESRHPGSYREIIGGIHETLNAVLQPFEEVNEQLRKMAIGQAADLIDAERYAGEFKVISENVNSVRLAIRHLIKDTTMLAEAALEGQLQTRANAEEHNGVYRKIIEGINDTLDAAINPVNEAARVLRDLSEGDLSTYVLGEYKGDHAIIKEALNNTIFSIRGYIEEISVVLGRMAQGDMDLTITSDYKGSYSSLKDSINSIIKSLNAMLLEINRSAEQVAAGTRQISDGSQTLAQGASEMANSVDEFSSAIHRISVQTRQNADNASRANALAGTARLSAARGNEQMIEMLGAMEEINEASGNISKVIKVIDDIAFQTNILALNAAVEAARAGVHGKGFSVVAEEVRNLAAKSADAAKETAVMIEGSVKKAEQGTRLAKHTAEALAEITDNVGKAAALVEQITAASEEQAGFISRINKGIEQVNVVVQNDSATAEESAAASEELSAQAELLKSLAGRFKLRDNIYPESGLASDL